MWAGVQSHQQDVPPRNNVKNYSMDGMPSATSPPYSVFPPSLCHIEARNGPRSDLWDCCHMAPTTRSAMEIELSKLSSPRIFLVRMVVFLVLCALIGFVLYRQIISAFFANPGL